MDSGTPFSFVGATESLHEAARRVVGHSDFGNPVYLNGFRVLMEAYDREAHFSPAGRESIKGLLVHLLENRLRAQRMWTEEPAILRTEIRRPLFILGTVRSGTTVLHQLLAQDPANQVVENWLALRPRPRPPRALWDSDPDYQAAIRAGELTLQLVPALQAIHFVAADAAEECFPLFQQNFTDHFFDQTAHVPSYSAWFDRVDMVPTYEHHRDLLKLIGWTSPERRWLLKYPSHLSHLRALFAVYPDACIVHTHRDPCKVIPSICSLLAHFRTLYEDKVDLAAVGRQNVEYWSTRLEAYLETRRTYNPDQFFDLHFRDIVSDPVGAARRVYEHFQLEWTEALEQRLRRWHADNPRDKHGEHLYRAEEFGLTSDGIAERFQQYMKHFDIERERSR